MVDRRRSHLCTHDNNRFRPWIDCSHLVNKKRGKVEFGNRKAKAITEIWISALGPKEATPNLLYITFTQRYSTGAKTLVSEKCGSSCDAAH